MNDLVSVIIPTYKRAIYLSRAIDSVLNQTYNAIEIIVVDDNEPDSLYRVENENVMDYYLNKYKDKIRYYKHECNKNGATARNTGITNAKGNYITFLDDDDIFLKNRVEKMVDILQKNKGYEGAYSGYACVKNKNIIYTSESKKFGNLLFDVLKQNSFFGTGSNMFFSKKIVDKIGFFDENFIRHQDMEYMCRFFNYSEIINVPDILVIKNLDDNQNIPNYEKMKKTKEMFLNKFKKEIENLDIEKQKQVYFYNYYELLNMENYDTNEYKKIVKTLKNIDLPFKYKIKLLKPKIKRNKFLRKIISLTSSMKMHNTIKYIDNNKIEEIKSFYK